MRRQKKKSVVEGKGGGGNGQSGGRGGCADVGTGGVMASKLDLQNYTSEFESHWVPYSSILVSHLSKRLSKLQPKERMK